MNDINSDRPPLPKAPLSTWVKPHAFHPDYGFCWYSQEDVVLVTQATKTWGDVAGARVLSDWIDAALAHESEGIERAGGVLMIHDWRLIKGYSAEARLLMNERIRRRKIGYARSIVQVVHLTPFWRMALQVTNVTFALLGMKNATMTEDIGRAFNEIRNLRFERQPSWLKT